jgi:hypothetical protein
MPPLLANDVAQGFLHQMGLSATTRSWHERSNFLSAFREETHRISAFALFQPW